MTNTFRSLLLVSATLMSFAAAQAQVVTYKYTAALDIVSDTFFGSTVTGTITLDLSAVPTTPSPDSTHGQSEWRNVPGIKITAQASNFNAGTGSNLFVDDTVASQSIGLPGMPLGFTMGWLGFDDQVLASDVRQIQINLGLPSSDLNKFANLSASSVSGGYITLYDATHSGSYIITSISGPPSNILIGGVDTGIKDITYQGQSVSAILAGYAASAKNHGDYVSSVEKLVEKLLKAKLLTKAQTETLKQAAEKSSIGQKPKKEKEDKDDKGKGDKEDNAKDD